jgi:hypothetical protein
MSVSLDFAISHHYTEAKDGINVPIALSVGRQSVELLAKLDTGAAHCIFERKYAEILGLDVESGRLQRFRTVAGSFGAYEHEVTVQTLGIEFSSMVFFARDPGIQQKLPWPRGLVGSTSHSVLSITTCGYS